MWLVTDGKQQEKKRTAPFEGSSFYDGVQMISC